MIKFYGIALALGALSLVVVIFGGAIADSVNRPDRDPGSIVGTIGRLSIGSVLGFGMGGMSAEFSTMDLGWQVSLVFAVLGAILGGLWAWWASREEPGEPGSHAGSL
jgi:hypothetical protein